MHQYLFRIILMWLGGSMIIGCSTDDLPVIPLNPGQSFYRLSDSTYLSGMNCIVATSRGFFADDAKNFRILHFDPQLRLLNTFKRNESKSGKFKHLVGILEVYEDSIYIFSGGHEIEVFDIKGNYQRNLQVPVRDWEGRFVIYQGKFYLSSCMSETAPITIFDSQDKGVQHVGEWIGAEAERLMRDVRLLRMDRKGRLFAVGRSEPIVEKYSEKGELLERLDLSGLKVLQKLSQFIEKYRQAYLEKGEKNFTPYFFVDAYIDASYLYIVCAPWKEDTPPGKVLVIDLNREQMTPVGILNLYGDSPTVKIWLSTLCVTSDQRIVAFSLFENKIYEYQMNLKLLEGRKST